MLRKSLVLACACGVTFSAQAAEVEIALTDQVIEGGFLTDAEVMGLPSSELSFGLLFSDDRDIVASAGLMVPALGEETLQVPVLVSFGARAYGALLADPSDDIFGLAPGVQARFALPTGIPLAVVGNFFYAPEILTFGDADDVLDFNVRLEAQFMERVAGFVGFRLLNFDRDDGEDDIVESIQVGARFAL